MIIHTYTIIINKNYGYKLKKKCHFIRSLSVRSVKPSDYHGPNKVMINYFQPFKSLHAARRAASKLYLFL